jgi:hypothetical protein
MLNNKDFLDLERRLWREGNPLTDELTSTRDELIYLLRESQKIAKKYSHVISSLSDPKDIEFFREWDNFLDTLENIDYALGDDHVQYKMPTL